MTTKYIEPGCARAVGRTGFEVVGEASDARTAYAMDERTHPDLTAVDFWLPGSDGVCIIRELRRRNSERRVAMLSASATPALMCEAMEELVPRASF